jgi:TPR repeat protein
LKKVTLIFEIFPQCFYIMGIITKKRKEMMYCTKCNVERDGKFCSECGTKLVECMAVEAETCYRTAEDYYYGRNGKDEDNEEAAKWYLKAAEQGHADAQYKLAGCYENGWGVDEDGEAAAEWYMKAAEQGHADAQYEIGYILYNVCDGCEEEGLEWWQKAAEQGQEDAINILKELE